MADPPRCHDFPHDEALCERCGYPLKGLSAYVDCPECGLAVAQSSPVNRTLWRDHAPFGSVGYLRLAPQFLRRPSATFRTLAIDGSQIAPRRCLFWSATLAAVCWTAIFWTSGFWQAMAPLPGYSYAELIASYWAVFASIYLLSYIEMLGVTAFSNRRGWRVPFALAKRVCCLASVGWLPGVLIAGLGFWLIQAFGEGRPWFEQLVGLVRVSWLCYAGLFVLSFLWFETLVWLGVRKLRYANAWPKSQPGPAQEIPDA